MKKIQNYGWYMVAFGILVMLFLHYGTIGSQAIFMLPMVEDLKVTTTRFTMASTYSMLLGFLVTPVAGRLLNRKSIRLLLFAGIAGTAVSMILQSFVTTVGQYYAVIIFRSFFSCFVTALPFPTLIARWFDKDKRSFANSMVFVGISLGGVLLSSPLAAAIEKFGWRVTYRWYGLLALLILSPLCLLIVRDYPKDYDQRLKSEAAGSEDSGIDFISLFKNRKFVLVCIGIGALTFMGGSLYHVSSYVQSLGYSAAFGAAVISLYNLVCLFAKMVSGRLFDRRGMKAGVFFGVAGTVAAYAIMALSNFRSGTVLLIIFGIFYGIGNTTQSITGPSVVSSVFGVRNYGEIYAKMYTVTSVIGAFGSPVLSRLYEASGSYLPAGILLTLMGVLSMVCLFKAGTLAERDERKKEL